MKRILFLLILSVLVSHVAWTETIQDKMRRIRQEESENQSKKKPSNNISQKSASPQKQTALQPRESQADQPPLIETYAPNAAVKNCGTDFNCFLDTVQRCVRSRFQRSVINQSPIEIEAKEWLNIEGIKNGHCSLYIRHEDFKQGELKEGENKMPNVLDGRCYIDRAAITNLLEKWYHQSFSYSILNTGEMAGDLEGTRCEGPLFKKFSAKQGGCEEQTDKVISCSWKSGQLSLQKEGDCQRAADCPHSPKAKYVDCVDYKCVQRQCYHDLDCPSVFGSLFVCDNGTCRDKNNVASLPSLEACLQTPCENCKLGHDKIYSQSNKSLCVECSLNENCLPSYDCKAYRCVLQQP